MVDDESFKTNQPLELRGLLLIGYKYAALWLRANTKDDMTATRSMIGEITFQRTTSGSKRVIP